MSRRLAQIRADSYCLPLISGISALPAADEIKKVSTSGLSRTRLKDCLGELFTGMQLINPHVRPPPPPQQQQPLTPYAPQVASSLPHSAPPLTPPLQPHAPSKSKPRSPGICAHDQEGEAGGQGGRVDAGGLLRSGQIRPDPVRSVLPLKSTQSVHLCMLFFQPCPVTMHGSSGAGALLQAPSMRRGWCVRSEAKYRRYSSAGTTRYTRWYLRCGKRIVVHCQGIACTSPLAAFRTPKRAMPPNQRCMCNPTWHQC